MPYTGSFVRKALLDSQMSMITEVSGWDPAVADMAIIEEWKSKIDSLDGMLKHTAQESEMRRRHVNVIQSEIDLFERSARSINVLNPGAGRDAAASADIMRKDLETAKQQVADSEALEANLSLSLDTARSTLLKAESMQDKG